MQPAGDLAGQRRADDAGGVADDEGHLLRRRVRRCEDKVTLVFAVVVVSHDDDFASGEGVDRLPDTGLGHDSVLPTTPPASRSRWRPRIPGSTDGAWRLSAATG